MESRSERKPLRTVHCPGEQELSKAKKWAEENFSKEKLPPFSFVYDGKLSAMSLENWRRSCKTMRIDGVGIQYIITCADPETGLEVTCEAIAFNDYPAVEWVLYFQNTGGKDTPILENIQALDINITRDERQDILYPQNEFLLHRWRGCMCKAEDFGMEVEVLPPGKKYRLFCLGGRSSSGNDTLRQDGSLPFFNIEAIDEGLIVAIGWTGQWLAQFERVGERDLNIKAGMELTHLKLFSKEKIRTPRILLFFWEKDRIAGHNKFRQFILDHHTPKEGSEPVQVPFAANAWFQFRWGNDVNEKNQIEFVKLYAKNKIPLEHFWIDAGWYGRKGNWAEDVGDWFPKKEAFPKGLKPVADEVRKLGMGFFLWFEPERVYQGTQLYDEHPEWLFMPSGDMNQPVALLNLGNPEARKWITDLISGMISELGMEIYRQDLNFDPLTFWRNADAPDRQGMSEIRHIEGLYEFWDELLRRHPGLIIDNCATGSRRFDLETISRSINLWRSDFSHPHGVQSHGYALSFFLPATAGGGWYFDRIDSYVFRSNLANGMPLAWDVRLPNFDRNQALKNIKEFKMLRPLYYGDFYPLTGYSASKDTWLAYQIHREDLGRGAVLVFRRTQSPYLTAIFRLSGLNPNVKYEVTNIDTRAKRILTGKKLMAGIRFTLPEPESSQLLTYKEE